MARPINQEEDPIFDNYIESLKYVLPEGPEVARGAGQQRGEIQIRIESKPFKACRCFTATHFITAHLGPRELLHANIVHKPAKVSGDGSSIYLKVWDSSDGGCRSQLRNYNLTFTDAHAAKAFFEIYYDALGVRGWDHDFLQMQQDSQRNEPNVSNVSNVSIASNATNETNATNATNENDEPIINTVVTFIEDDENENEEEENDVNIERRPITITEDEDDLFEDEGANN